MGVGLEFNCALKMVIQLTVQNNNNTISVERQIGLFCLFNGSQRKVVTNETQNIDKDSYFYGHYLNAVYLVLIANLHILEIRLHTFWVVMLCYDGLRL